MPEALQILGVPVHPFADVEACARNIEIEMGCSNTAKVAVAINPEKINCARQQPDLAAMIKHADYCFADGVGVVLAMRHLHRAKVSRVAGVELFFRLLQGSVVQGNNVYLFGSQPDTVLQAKASLEKRYPGINIIGHCDGYFKIFDEQALVSDIKHLKPDFVFVALGSPRQELWINKWRHELPVKFIMGVGGSFDVAAGKVRRAPKWTRRLGLEWAYRIFRQPGRIKRLPRLLGFLFSLLCEQNSTTNNSNGR